MIRRLRSVSGARLSGVPAFGVRARRKAVDAAVSRGMADILAALDDVIDDDAALGRIYAGFGQNGLGAAAGRGAGTVAGAGCAPAGQPGSAITTGRPGGPVAPCRRAAVRWAAVVSAGLAVAVAAVVVPGAGHNATDLTAYVVKRTDRALSAAGPGRIARLAVTTSALMPGGKTTTTTEEWFYGDRWRAVTDLPAGNPVYDEGSSSASLYTLVGYGERIWARQPGLGRLAAPVSGSRGCEQVAAALPLLFHPGLPHPGFSATSPPAASVLRAAISCGTLAVAGRHRIDGTQAIELASRPDSPIAETIWVSPDTYLPVRVVVRLAPGQPVLQTADITWLTPTGPNLAQLTVPVPAGFRRVLLTRAVAQIARQIPGGQPDGVGH
jgi:hypothetical protein